MTDVFDKVNDNISRQYFLESFDCSGSETNLNSCSRTLITSDNCVSVGVICREVKNDTISNETSDVTVVSVSTSSERVVTVSVTVTISLLLLVVSVLSAFILLLYLVYKRKQRRRRECDEMYVLQKINLTV